MLLNGVWMLFIAAALQKTGFDSQKPHFYLITWEEGGKKKINHYLSANPPFQLEEYLKYAESAGIYSRNAR